MNEIENEDGKSAHKEKYTVSYVRKHFKQLTINEKQKQNAEFIDDLYEKNKTYFEGREVDFIQGFSYL